ncbi:MAG: O-acetylhomoserine sulfhydrylase / O-succinylhomoserine sulfhydrylase, partial [uncultured Acetobacteraceae bacterium]
EPADLHQPRDPRPARRQPPRRNHHRRRRRADLPDHLLPVPGHRPRRAAVRPARDGQHLHPHHEPHLRRAGNALGGDGGRGGGAGGGLRAGGQRLLRDEPVRGGRQRRVLHGPLRRHLEPLRQHAEAVRRRDALRGPGRPRELPPRDRRAHPLLLRGNAAQPEAPGLPDRRSGEDRPRTRRAAHHGQHGGAGDVPSARPRRGGGDVLHHQVDRRPRHGHRRRGDRWRQLRLGQVGRPLPHAEQARPELPRRGVDGSGEAARPRGLRPADAHLPAARPRRADGAVQRLPRHPRPRNPAAADGAAQRQRHPRRRLARRAGRRDQGDPPEPDGRRGAAPRRRLPARRPRQPHGHRAGRRRRGRGALHRRVEAVLPRRQHRRRALPGHPPGHHHPQPALAGGPGAVGRDAGLRAAVHRHRARGRHPGGPGAGAGRRRVAAAGEGGGV